MPHLRSRKVNIITCETVKTCTLNIFQEKFEKSYIQLYKNW
jgi:hypothetical protein